MGSRSYPDADLAKRLFNPLTGPGKAQTITVFKRRIRYHWPFAIPAFIVILALLATIASAIAVCSTNRFGLGSLHAVLRRTSIGRILSDLLYPEVAASPNSKTSAWIQHVGKVEVDFSNHYPMRGKGQEQKAGAGNLLSLLMQQDSAPVSDAETSHPLMQQDSAPVSDAETSHPLMQQDSAPVSDDAERCPSDRFETRDLGT